MIAVILRPHSNTNPSEKFRVVDSEVWIKKQAATPILGECDTFFDAITLRDQLNAAEA
jgi:hypothetical protein